MSAGTSSRLTVPAKWEIALCEPVNPPGPGCQPTAIARYSRTKPTMYRGACLGCGWIGIDREDSNTAVEDTHDHTHPGWRDLPVVDVPRRTGNPRRNDKNLHAVGVAIAAAYPPDWPERCGPIRAWRDSPVATRHVPGDSPWGGYEMAVLREPQAEPAPVLEQLALPI